MNTGATAPNCWRCAHLGISHDRRQPYWCRLMGFQSARLPSIDVMQVDGHPCRGFAPKPPRPVARAGGRP
jgi:hypothetical protein